MWPEGKEGGVTFVPRVEKQSPQEPQERRTALSRQGAQWIGP